MIGEIELLGRLRAVGNPEQSLAAADRAGAQSAIVPETNRGQIEAWIARTGSKIQILYAKDIAELVSHALGNRSERVSRADLPS